MTYKLHIWEDDRRQQTDITTREKVESMESFVLEGIPWTIDRELLGCGTIIRRGYLLFATEAEAALFKLTRL